MSIEEELEKEKYQKYNHMVQALFSNMITISKPNNKKIILSNFSDDEFGKTSLIVANQVISLFNYDVYLDLSFFNYLKMKIKFHKISFKRYNKNKMKELSKFDIEKETKYISDSLGLPLETWREVYYNFYATEKEREKNNYDL